MLVVLLTSSPAFAQVDIVGLWGNIYHEDQPERIMPGPDVGDYLGIPLTPGGRLKALTWDASILTLPERQALPHPSTYSIRGPANLNITKEIDPVSLRLIAYRVAGTFGRADRTIWMDGRPHPPEEAAHTWAGFSTGRWEGNTLVVRTTHLKQGWLRRNGVAHSDRATLSERWMRHGNILTVMSVVYDPAYLAEPYVKTTDFVLNPYQPQNQGGGGGAFQIVDEIAGRPVGYVPHHLPDTNEQIKEFADREGLPLFATMGGPETMYPELVPRLAVWRRDLASKRAAELAEAKKVDPLMGTWKLDVARSTFEGRPPYARQLTFRLVGDAIRTTQDTNVVAQAGAIEGEAGSPVPAPRDRARVDYTAKYDGKDYPVVGAALETVSLRRIDARTVERLGKVDGKVVETTTMKQSADGNTLTVTTVGAAAPDGKPYERVEVYFRQDGGRLAGGR
ncbi:MAG: hypothetical protein HY657_06355 [Acidobacteria bacterium]|nr:hypothetical protein [Acidobacteriota bacterium]